MRRISRTDWYALFLAAFVICAKLAFGVETKPTIQEVLDEIKAQEIQHDTIVLQQAMWESGWLKCTNCSWRYNNMFGFRTNGWVSKSNPKGYIKFDTWQESIAYYKKWQDKNYNGSQDYYAFLIRVGYAEDTDYITHIRSCRVRKRLNGKS